MIVVVLGSIFTGIASLTEASAIGALGTTILAITESVTKPLSTGLLCITLEWTTPVKGIHGNWPGAIPHVYRWSYDYSKTDENGEYIIPEQDYIPQNIPLKDGEEEMH